MRVQVEEAASRTPRDQEANNIDNARSDNQSGADKNQSAFCRHQRGVTVDDEALVPPPPAGDETVLGTCPAIRLAESQVYP